MGEGERIKNVSERRRGEREWASGRVRAREGWLGLGPALETGRLGRILCSVSRTGRRRGRARQGYVQNWKSPGSRVRFRRYRNELEMWGP